MAEAAITHAFDAIAFVVGIYVSGVVLYYISRAVRRSRGVNLDLLYKEIPPE